MQTCKGYRNLLTKTIWDAMQTKDDGSLIHDITNNLEDFGLVYANEPTYVHIGCTVAAARSIKKGEEHIRFDIEAIYAFSSKPSKGRSGSSAIKSECLIMA